MILLQQMAIFFFIMFLGFLAARKGIVDTGVSKSLSWIIVNIANPALILSGGISGARTGTSGGEIGTSLVLAVGMFGSLMFLAWLFPLLLRMEYRKRGGYRLMFVFTNLGFMGFPLISNVYGKGALIHATLYVLLFNLLIYTYGILCIQYDSEAPRESRWKSIGNPGVVMGVAAVVIYMLKLSLPGVVVQAADMLSSLTGPLSMLVIGASFADMDMKELYRDKKLLLFVLVRLTVVPILAIWLVKGIVGDGMVCNVFRIMIATPVASMCAMMAKQYSRDDNLVTRGVALSTLLSVVTIPFVVAVT